MFLSGLLLALHLLGVAAWVGGMAFAILVLRPSLSVLDPGQRLVVHEEVFRRFFRMIWHVMPLVLLSGYAMLFAIYGGLAHVDWTVHLMHLLGLAMAGVFITIFIGPWRDFRRTRAPDDRAHAVGRIRPLIVINLLLGALTIVIAAIGAG
jgi:uncharacterized membrane protein